MRKTYVLIMLVVASLGGCSDPEPSVSPGASSTTNGWEAPANYEFDLLSRCGERNLIGRFHVVVKNGEASAKPLDESARAFFKYGAGEGVPTLEQLLEEADKAQRSKADVVEVAYSPEDGHPTRIEIDQEVDAIDDEACYEVTNYADRSSS